MRQLFFEVARKERSIMHIPVHPGHILLGGRLSDFWRSRFEFAQSAYPGLQAIHVSMIRNDSRLPSARAVFLVPVNARREWYNRITLWLSDWARKN
jgi:hypothetical protein